MDNNLQNIKGKIRHCLNELYKSDFILFERNNGEGIGERCITFRFAMYLQNQFDNHYVDVEYDNSMTYFLDNDGSVMYSRENKGKPIPDSRGFERKRIPDIIIHKRDLIPANDYLCFELKKWNRLSSGNLEKDHNNLVNFTLSYKYDFGFHIMFGKEKEETKWTIFQDGGILEDNILVFENSV